MSHRKWDVQQERPQGRPREWRNGSQSAAARGKIKFEAISLQGKFEIRRIAGNFLCGNKNCRVLVPADDFEPGKVACTFRCPRCKRWGYILAVTDKPPTDEALVAKRAVPDQGGKATCQHCWHTNHISRFAQTNEPDILICPNPSCKGLCCIC